MGKSYSSDLRERVIGYVEAGHSRREAARRFGVSPSFAVKLMSRRLKTGFGVPARQGRPLGGGKLGRHAGFLIGRVKERPDITMPELATALKASFHVKASPASLSRFLCKAGFTYKKNAFGLGTRTRRCETGAADMDRPASPPNAA
jgi:transposase